MYFKRINFCRDLCHGVVEHSLIRVVNDGGFIGLTFALKGIFGVKMIFRMLMVPKSVKKHLFFKLLYSNVIQDITPFIGSKFYKTAESKNGR